MVAYLATVGSTPANQRKPFCLIVSLANPHDIGFYPNGYDLAGGGYPTQVPDLGVTLPDNFNDPLTTKPNIQTLYRGVVETGILRPKNGSTTLISIQISFRLWTRRSRWCSTRSTRTG